MIKESEEWVDKLVVDMEESLEDEGVALTNAAFHFDELDCKKMGLSLDQLNCAIRKAASLGLIKIFTYGKEEKCNGDNAHVQIGNDNVQNISNVFKFMIEQIDKLNATSEEKHSAKEMLKKFIEHPLVNTILGTAGGALTSLLR